MNVVKERRQDRLKTNNPGFEHLLNYMKKTDNMIVSRTKSKLSVKDEKKTNEQLLEQPFVSHSYLIWLTNVYQLPIRLINVVSSAPDSVTITAAMPNRTEHTILSTASFKSTVYALSLSALPLVPSVVSVMVHLDA